MERWQIEVRKVKVVMGRLPLRSTDFSAKHQDRVLLAGAKEEKIRELARSYLEKAPELPEDIAVPLARLQAFFIKRFGRR
jgi:hypothetical protein